MRQAFIDTPHQTWYEPEPGGVGAARTDAEYLPLPFAESLGATTPERTGVAYVIHAVSHRPDVPAPRVITGVTLDGPGELAFEIRVVFDAIKGCVEKYNGEAEVRILSVGIGDEFLHPDRLSATRLRSIIAEAGL